MTTTKDKIKKTNKQKQEEHLTEFLKGYTTDKKGMIDEAVTQAIAGLGSSSEELVGMLTALKVKKIHSIPDQDLPAFKEALEKIKEKDGALKEVLEKIKEKDVEAKKRIAINKKRKEKNNKENKLTIMNAIKDIKEKERLKQKEIATLLDIKQPRVSDLLNLKHKRFSIDILINYLDDFGLMVNFEKVDTKSGKPIKVNIINIKKKII